MIYRAFHKTGKCYSYSKHGPKFKVGDIVYSHHSPRVVGKILSFKEESRPPAPNGNVVIDAVADVKMNKKGNPVERFSVQSLKHLKTLIEETESKLKNHRSRMKQAEKL